MIRWGLLLVLAAGAVAYSFWLYMRVELSVPAARLLAAARAVALVVLLLLLFDLRLPTTPGAAGSTRWVLLDASLSMDARAPDGSSAWDAASERARTLAGAGWRIVTFGDGTSLAEGGPDTPMELRSLLAPALERAVETGAREVRVLSDMRLEDAVAVRSALEVLPLQVDFEAFGEAVSNAGVSRIEVPDLARPEGAVTAQVEVHGGVPGDSLQIEVREEDRVVARRTVAAPSPGLRVRVPVELPAPETEGRVRYTASVAMEGDGFEADDETVTYANVGHEEGALVLVSFSPDWEPRHLLPVLEEVTGLSPLGYLYAGPDLFLPMGRAIERGRPADSASVRRSAEDAALLVLHGVGAGMPSWAEALVGQSGPKLLLLRDEVGAALAGIPSEEPRDGEWYVSPELPSSPVTGSLSDVALQGLPPLTGVLLPSDPASIRGALLVQLRGAGTLEPALHLDESETGRRGLALASGFWRWATREGGRTAYRRLWSSVAGWLLGGASVAGGEPGPAAPVVARGEPVLWRLPGSGERHLVVSRADTVVVDTLVRDVESLATAALPPGPYTYRIEGEPSDSVHVGRFDVRRATEEMVPAPRIPRGSAEGAVPAARSDALPGRPLRTTPWPYLLIITLLCAEWVGRRRSGLR